MLDVGGRQGRPRSRGGRRRGARSGRPGHRGAARPLRRAAVGRHVAGGGAVEALPRRRGRRQRHQRVRRPATTCPRPPRPAPRWWPPTSGSAHASPIPSPHYDDVVAEVCAFLADRAAQAEAAGIPRERIMVDAGLDLGKTEAQSLELLRRSDRLAALGYPRLPVGVEQALPRPPARHRRHRPTRGDPRCARPRRRPRVPHPAGPRRPGRPTGERRDGRHPRGAGDRERLRRPRPGVPAHGRPTTCCAARRCPELVGRAGRRRRPRLCGRRVRPATTTTSAAAVDAAQTPPFLTR